MTDASDYLRYNKQDNYQQISKQFCSCFKEIFWNFMSKVSLPKGYRRIISQSHNSPLSLRIYIIKIYLYLVYYTCTYNRSELHSKSFQTPVQPWVLSHSIVGWLYKVNAYYKMILNLISGNLVSWTRSLWLLLPSMQ